MPNPGFRPVSLRTFPRSRQSTKYKVHSQRELSVPSPLTPSISPLFPASCSPPPYLALSTAPPLLSSLFFPSDDVPFPCPSYFPPLPPSPLHLFLVPVSPTTTGISFLSPPPFYISSSSIPPESNLLILCCPYFPLPGAPFHCEGRRLGRVYRRSVPPLASLSSCLPL